MRTDVSDEASAKACAEAAATAFGGIDYLVNNAAIFGDMLKAGYLTVDLAYLEKFMRVNAHGCLIMTRAALPYLEKRPGAAIVNQSSTAAWNISKKRGKNTYPAGSVWVKRTGARWM